LRVQFFIFVPWSFLLYFCEKTDTNLFGLF